ncbi:hypothetical protein EYR38_003743 [Pleurotus pulmonarius]|nr:hypothetical protein EYR38_003743 [Pleurotus pulmonarius]
MYLHGSDQDEEPFVIWSTAWDSLQRSNHGYHPVQDSLSPPPLISDDITSEEGTEASDTALDIRDGQYIIYETCGVATHPEVCAEASTLAGDNGYPYIQGGLNDKSHPVDDLSFQAVLDQDRVLRELAWLATATTRWGEFERSLTHMINRWLALPPKTLAKLLFYHATRNSSYATPLTTLILLICKYGAVRHGVTYARDMRAAIEIIAVEAVEDYWRNGNRLTTSVVYFHTGPHLQQYSVNISAFLGAVLGGGIVPMQLLFPVIYNILPSRPRAFMAANDAERAEAIFTLLSHAVKRLCVKEKKSGRANEQILENRKSLRRVSAYLRQELGYSAKGWSSASGLGEKTRSRYFASLSDVFIVYAIFENILKPSQLATCCLVSKAASAFAIPLLYDRILIYAWHKGAKIRVVQVFNTLAKRPGLARYVHSLELRDFPKGPEIGVYGAAIFLLALDNCINLQRCIWTRDGSLNNDILKSLSAHQQLQSLTINGHSARFYDARCLLDIRGLRDICVIMPSAEVVRVLVEWAELNANTLRGLEIICKTSPLIADEHLALIASSCTTLERLRLAGCSKVSHDGVSSFLSSNRVPMVELALEGLSPSFKWAGLSLKCSNHLTHMRSITLSIGGEAESDFAEWVESVATMLLDAPLEQLQIYSTGPRSGDPTHNELWSRLITPHVARLTRFSVHRMLLLPNTIEDICRKCSRLEQLFIAVPYATFDLLGPPLASAINLRTLHLNFPQTFGDPPLVPLDKALALVRQCSSTLTQLGCNTRVWQVVRDIRTDDQGNPYVERSLGRYEKPDIPEQFLVVHT